MGRQPPSQALGSAGEAVPRSAPGCELSGAAALQELYWKQIDDKRIDMKKRMKNELRSENDEREIVRVSLQDSV